MLSILLAAVLASNSSGKTLVRSQPGTSVPSACRLRTNLITNSENLSAWNVAAGAPTLAADNFADTAGQLTCDTITDTSAAVQDGYDPGTYTTTPGTYTFSCWFAAGTASSLMLRATVTGTGVSGHGTSCTFTAIPGTLTRYSCTATIGGSPITAASWQIRIGDTVGVTGSLRVCQCQVMAGAVPGPYIRTTAVPVTACR